MAQRELISDVRAAALLGCSRTSIWRYAANGTIPKPMKIGRMSRWKIEYIENVIFAADARRKKN